MTPGQRRTYMFPRLAAVAMVLVWLGDIQQPVHSQGGSIPRTTWDRKPDLNGIWQALSTANWDLEDHEGGPSPVFVTGAWGATLPGLSVVEGGTIPYKPEALAKREENRKNALPGKPGRNLNADPELNCFLPGVPRATYLPHPFQIFQSPNRMWMVYQFSVCSPRDLHERQDPRRRSIRGWAGRTHGGTATRWSSTSGASTARRGSIGPATTTPTPSTSWSATA